VTSVLGGGLEIAHGVGLAESQSPSDVEIAACGGGHRGIRRVRARDECAEAAAGFDDAGGFQLPVCAGHGVDGQTQLTSQFTYRRQPDAGRQRAITDGIDDLVSELVEQRTTGLPVDPQPFPLLHLLSIPQSGYLGGVRITVLSGAGISAESGVPTFRDDKNGLWAKFDPYELSSTQGWLRNPERVWGWYLWRHYLVATVEPNPGHLAVAAWQDHAEVSVVTQNVDDLHERAGSSPVHHLHGSLFEFRCDTCGLPYTGELPEMTEPALEVEPPTHDCGGLIRPDIVWFGEPLPEEPWQRAVEATTSADLLVVVGTSAIVYPAASLPELALARGTVVIEVNPEPTPLSDSATITVRETASQALPTLLQRLPAV
jgi:NAD-dependent deacetylase